ncbi:unnamed protein product [Vitrella brassicaformis CCMP3155]|uniref:Uncharacterized protein n=1 Tax=Vitrella brassicaformis (strain CCMP3155) TaxID=1169540 RepID=A0A0G4H3A8_VITBC|nr:unnamed protein product [Vitrella brassicaformis CCMP3155]|eukprot:CEM38186.1 unnamed protein product [Vitrella brassicaformis CCMP3155]
MTVHSRQLDHQDVVSAAAAFIAERQAMEAAWVRQIGSQTPDCIRSQERQRVEDLLQMVDWLPFGHLDSDVYDGIRDRIDRIIEL